MAASRIKPPSKPAAPAAKPVAKPAEKPVQTTTAAPAPAAKPQPQATTAIVAAPVATSIAAPAAPGQLAAPSFIPQGAEHARRGKENIEPEDLGTPRLTLLQALSPEVVDANKGHARGYVPGTYYYPPADKLLGSAFTFVVISMGKEHIWWKPRSEGGGGILARASNEQIRAGQYPQGTGPEDFEFINGNPPRVTTHMGFLVLMYDPQTDTLDPLGFGPLIFSFQRSTMAGGKSLCRKLMSLQAPAYAAVFTAKSKQTTNKKGHSFFVHDINAESTAGDEKSGWVRSEATFKALEALHERFGRVAIKANYDRNDEEALDESITSDGSDGGPPQGGSEEVF